MQYEQQKIIKKFSTYHHTSVMLHLHWNCRFHVTLSHLQNYENFLQPFTSKGKCEL